MKPATIIAIALLVALATPAMAQPLDHSRNTTMLD